jgi:hypothetical protein
MKIRNVKWGCQTGKTGVCRYWDLKSVIIYKDIIIQNMETIHEDRSRMAELDLHSHVGFHGIVLN